MNYQINLVKVLTIFLWGNYNRNNTSSHMYFNYSLNTGIFPGNLNIAEVIPIYKKGSLNNISNYRSISLLPSISKILEKLVFKQLITYLNENKLLFDSEYGFRAGHSTELVSIELIDIITQDLERGKIPITIFLDLSKAFDTLHYVILRQIINYYGIQSVDFKILKTICFLW